MRRRADNGSPRCPRIDDRRVGRPLLSPAIASLPWLLVALLAWLDTLLPPLITTRADFGASAAVALIITVAGFLKNLFGGRIDAKVKRALDGLKNAIVAMGKEIAEFFRNVGGKFGDVWSWVRRQWRNVIVPALRKLDRYVKRVFKWLKDTFGPIIEFLQKVRRELLKFYDKWFRPIFDTIDVIRRVLGIFSLFGLEWSRKLDQKLAELEDAIRRPFLLLVQKVNEIIDVVDRIVTLDGLLQRITLLRSVVRDVYSIAGIWHRAHSKPLTDQERQQIQAGAKLMESEEISAAFDEWRQTGGGPFAAEIAEHSAELRIRLRKYGYGTR